MFNFKKLTAVEIGQLVALIILFFLISATIIYFLSLAVLNKSFGYAILSALIIWATVKSAIFNVSVSFNQKEDNKTNRKE